MGYRTLTAVSGWTEGGYSDLGTSYAREGTLAALIFKTGSPGRVDSYAEGPAKRPRSPARWAFARR